MRRRDANVLIGGTAYALTVILAVRPGCEELLSDRLKTWWQPGFSPFHLLPSTHFARLVILDRLAFEGPAQLQPEISQQYLLFSATFDGADSTARDEYLESMCGRIKRHVESVFGLCAGAPRPVSDPVPFRDWLVANQVETRAFFAHSPKATVSDVRVARALRERVREFAIDHQYDRPDVLQRHFEAAFPR
jgi:hypothetical protein